MSIWYTTRERVKAALDVKQTARANGEIDDAIAASTDSIHGLTHRRFYPVLTTRSFDYPNNQGGGSLRVYLEANEMVSIDTLVSGGSVLDVGTYFLRRFDDLDEAPYQAIEVDRSTAGAFGTGATFQHSISATGMFMGCKLEERAAGELSAGVVSTITSRADVTDGASVGIGDILRLDNERVIVTDRLMTSTGDASAGALTASNADVAVTVADGTDFSVGETIAIDVERMLVVDIIDNILVVKRAWDGSVLATHAANATVWSPRRLVVDRGALGTTATSHTAGTVVYRHEPPPLIQELALAESINTLLQKQSGYARSIGTGENEREMAGRALRDIRAQVKVMFARKARNRAI